MYMNKYNNSSIYAILDEITKKIYIGHTIQPLNVRFSKHKNDAKRRFKEGSKRRSCASYYVIKDNNCDIQLIKHICCNNKKELEIIESQYIMAYQKSNEYECVNLNRPRYCNPADCADIP